MTLAVAWPDRTHEQQPWWRRWGRRSALALRLWQRGLARRRFVNRARAETSDPEVLADMGIRQPRTSPVDRWIAAMLWHQH